MNKFNLIFNVENDCPYFFQSLRYFLERFSEDINIFLDLKNCSKSFTKSCESFGKLYNLSFYKNEKKYLNITSNYVFTEESLETEQLKDARNISEIKAFQKFDTLEESQKKKYFINNFEGIYNINSHYPILILHFNIATILNFNLKHDFLSYFHFLVRDNQDWKELEFFLTDFKPRCIVSLGEPDGEILTNLSKIFTFHYCKKWIHFNNPKEVSNQKIEFCMTRADLHKGISDNPLVSVITPTYESKDRIFRPYHSLKNQTYSNWEWIILDDSKSDDTWKTLSKFAEDDFRIKIYRRQKNNGSIGANKRDCAALSSGKFIFELDHDDDILPQTFDRILSAAKKYPDAGFFYSDFIECYENTLKPFHYGHNFGLGFGSYYRSWWKNDFHYICKTQGVNMYTLRHIVGVPNHLRCWTREAYHSVGGYNSDLQVVDDYDLIIKTLLKFRWVHIPELLYIQYRNQGGDNFTFHRNALIQYLVQKIRDLHEDEIHHRVESLGDYDFLYKKNWVDSPLDFEIPFYQHPVSEYIYYHLDQDIHNPLISIVIIYDKNTIEEWLENIFNSEYQNFEILLVGNGENQTEMDDKIKQIDLCKKSRFKYYNLHKKYPENVILNYALKKMCNSNWITYYTKEILWKSDILNIFVQNIRKDGHLFYLEHNKLLLHHLNLNYKYGLWDQDEFLNLEKISEKFECQLKYI
jgi:glycosyltransferase involved in cell wall biosynthesis